MKTFFIIPHGAKFNGADPEMTPEGKAQIKGLKPYLPNDISEIWRGEGKRHGQVAEVLGLVPTHYNALLGPASSVERRPTGAVTVLPDGSEFPFRPVDVYRLLKPIIDFVEVEIADNSIVCAGRELLMALTGKEAWQLKTALYRITVDGWTITCKIVRQAHGDF